MFQPYKTSMNSHRRVLHILIDENPLNVFNSVYCAIYLWHDYGYQNFIATGGSCDEFSDILDDVYPLHGTFMQKARQLSGIKGCFDIVIAYEPKDLEAFVISRFFFPKYNYKYLLHHSLEIPTFTYENPTIKNRFHRMVMFFGMCKIERYVIQDVLRQDLLLKLFPCLRRKQGFLVPNSFIPDIEPLSESLFWFDNIRAHAKHLVLYIGSIASWALSEELFINLMKLNEIDFLFSGWSRDGYEKKLRELCRECTNIHFHLGVKSRADLNYMVNHSDIGLALYDPKDENVRTMGLSSGKMFRYLNFRKPIVINEVPYMSNYVTENNFGIACKPSAIGNAINDIFRDYIHYQNAINANYDSNTSYEKCYSALIETLIGGGPK